MSSQHPTNPVPLLKMVKPQDSLGVFIILLTLSLSFLYPTLYYQFQLSHVETTIQKARLFGLVENHFTFPVSLIFAFLGAIFTPPRSWRFMLFPILFIGCLAAAWFLAPNFILGGIILSVAGVLCYRYPECWTRPSPILATLALTLFIFWLPFQLEASRRSFVARVKGDQRTIGIALETYYFDHESYPPATFDPREKAYWRSDSPLPSFPYYHPGGPATLTTPVAYLTAYSDFPDPIRYLKEGRTYAYYAEGAAWILVSPGPDCIFDMTADDMKRAVQSVRTNADTYALFASFTYDPSNGIESRGDVWRLKQ